MRTIIVYAYLAVYLLFSVFYIVPYRLLKNKPEKQIVFLENITRKWGRRMVRSTGCKVEVIGLENLPRSNVLLVGNHQSYLDIPLMLGYIPNLKGFVAKIEMAKAPIISYWMKIIGCLFLDRDSLRQSMEVILKGIEQLKAGGNLVIFPEGTRSKTGEVAEFKKGSLQLAVKSGVPVVPVTIDGSFRAYELHGKVEPTTVKITIHPAIHMESLEPAEKKELAEAVREIIIEGITT